MPTEAEWEKAARGPENYNNPWGNERYKDGYASIGDAGMGNIGSKEKDKSGYSVNDMAGNVQEWVNDWYDKQYYMKSPEENPRGPEAGTRKVVRGEHFFTNNKYSNRFDYFATSRFGMDPNIKASYIGFRCAKSVEDK